MRLTKIIMDVLLIFLITFSALLLLSPDVAAQQTCQKICEKYEKKCVQWGTECEQWGQQCSQYQDVCIRKDNRTGNCLTSQKQCVSYKQVCLKTKQVCKQYKDECVQWKTDCKPAGPVDGSTQKDKIKHIPPKPPTPPPPKNDQECRNNCLAIQQRESDKCVKMSDLIEANRCVNRVNAQWSNCNVNCGRHFKK